VARQAAARVESTAARSWFRPFEFPHRALLANTGSGEGINSVAETGSLSKEMSEPSPEQVDVLLYGEPRPAPNVLRGRAGPFSFVFEEGMLKHLRLGEVEIARRVYFAVRDPAWRTVRSKISNVQIEPQSESFKASWSGECLSIDVQYVWQGEIEIASSGLIRFQARGKALKTFTTPRIGICLLLSTNATMERAFEVTYVNGQTERLRFDKIFKRTQLACRWRSLKFSPVAGVEVDYRIEGSYFDLEDQRNFGDTSCKAMAGMPYKNQQALADQEHEQVLTIRVSREGYRIGTSPARDVVQLQARPGQIEGRLPPLGVSLGELDVTSPVSSAVPLLAELRGVLHVWLDGSSAKLGSQAELAKSFALQTGRPVYVTVKNLDEEVVPQIVSILTQWIAQGVVVQRLSILDNTHPGLTLLKACAREAGLSVPCGKAVSSFKDRAGLLKGANSGADFLAWQGTPLSHQEDDETLLENADVFPHQTATARSFAPQARFTIGPIRLDRSQPDTYLLPDPRHRGLLVAAFVASSLRALAQARVDLAIFFDAVGPTGHIGGLPASVPAGLGHPFPSAFPSYYVLREFGPLAGSETFEVESSDLLRVKAFGVNSPQGAVIVLMNQTAEVQRVSLWRAYEKGSAVRIRSLDEAAFATLAGVSDSSLPAIPELRRTIEAVPLDLEISAFSVTVLIGSR